MRFDMRTGAAQTVCASALGLVLAAALGACSSGHSAEWQDGYSYGQSAAKQDFTGGPLTGSAADDACNHALQAVPDGFGDPSNADWTAGFMAGCTDELGKNRPASQAGSGATTAPSPSAARTYSPVTGFAPVTDFDLTFQVLSAQYAESLPGQYGASITPADGGGFEVILLRVSNPPGTLDIAGFSTGADICGASGGDDSQVAGEVAPSVWGGTGTSLDQAEDGAVGPGETVEGGLVFDVPAGCRSFRLSVSRNGSADGGQQIKIPLPS
jgi:hypothetical protein